ncbi:DNA polymerase III subunit beta [Mesorhizobium silamurunense]|uniref:DNA polymerase III subunit beta n=1 Tax=Mesorhizobium silamurunense TaxID=499528 RepID=UPI00177CEB4A|nr:DNA polymerase III subunit beta [Mesorhizobium silamurunense]
MNAFNHDIARLAAGVAAVALEDIGGVSNVVPFAPRPVEPVAETAEPEPAAAEAPAASLEPATAVVDRAGLTRALDFIANVVEKRNAIPILSNVMLAASGNGLAVVGTDLDIEMSVAVSGAVDAHFALTLPAHTLRDLLKRASASEFVGLTSPPLRDDAWAATVDLEKVKYQLQMLPVADFPKLEFGTASNSFSVPGADLVEGFGGVAMAISTEETRYYLNGVYLHHVAPRAIDAYHGDHGAFRMVATDGHRLCRQDLAASDGMSGMPGVILPRKTVALLQKLLKGKACPETVAIGVNATKMRFSFDDGVTITSKLIDGSFPDYQRVIPTGNDKPAMFKAAELAEGIRSVSLISNVRNRAVKLGFSADACRLTVHDVDNGCAIADIAAAYANDEFEIGFNPGYLQAFIDTAHSETITLTLADAGSPTLITGERKGWLGVLMPTRI